MAAPLKRVRCAECRESFTPAAPSRGKPRVFCSTQCRQRHHYATVERPMAAALAQALRILRERPRTICALAAAMAWSWSRTSSAVAVWLAHGLMRKTGGRLEACTAEQREAHLARARRRICPYAPCGAEFVVVSRQQVYCSARCRQRQDWARKDAARLAARRAARAGAPVDLPTDQLCCGDCKALAEQDATGLVYCAARCGWMITPAKLRRAA